MASGSDVYYKVRDVVRQQGHSESESCRIFKDWHIELRVGSGHVSVWTSQGMVYMTMLDKPVHYLPGAWEEHLSRLHQGRPLLKPPGDLRELLRAQAMESEEDDMESDDGEDDHRNGEVAAATPSAGPRSDGESASADTAAAQTIEPLAASDISAPEAVVPELNGSESTPAGPSEAASQVQFAAEVILIDEDDIAE